MEQAARVWPATIEISADKITAVVTDDYAVRVQHGHNLEDECFTKKLCFLVVLLK